MLGTEGPTVNESDQNPGAHPQRPRPNARNAAREMDASKDPIAHQRRRPGFPRQPHHGRVQGDADHSQGLLAIDAVSV